MSSKQKPVFHSHERAYHVPVRIADVPIGCPFTDQYGSSMVRVKAADNEKEFLGVDEEGTIYSYNKTQWAAVEAHRVSHLPDLAEEDD